MMNLICSGSVLRSTEFVVGLVVYVGENTKIQMNMKKGPLLESWLFKRIHKEVYYLMALLFLIAFLMSVLSVIMSILIPYTRPNFDFSIGLYIWEFILRFPKAFGLSILQVSHTIPMSIYVAIEVLKLI